MTTGVCGAASAKRYDDSRARVGGTAKGLRHQQRAALVDGKAEWRHAGRNIELWRTVGVTHQAAGTQRVEHEHQATEFRHACRPLPARGHHGPQPQTTRADVEGADRVAAGIDDEQEAPAAAERDRPLRAEAAAGAAALRGDALAQPQPGGRQRIEDEHLVAGDRIGAGEHLAGAEAALAGAPVVFGFVVGQHGLRQHGSRCGQAGSGRRHEQIASLNLHSEKLHER